MQAGVADHAANHKQRLGSNHYVKERRRADVPKTASVVVQPRYWI